MITSNKKMIFSVIGVVVIVCVGSIFLMGISYNNLEVDLREQVKTQQEVIKLNYDKMFKVIAQVAQVPEQAKKTFKDIYPELIEGRYGNSRGGALMSWVQEHNPSFDWSLYSRVQVAIESNRQEFFLEQKKLEDFKREHSILIKKFPGSLFLSDISEIDIQVVTSTKTEKTFETGKEDDIKVFGD